MGKSLMSDLAVVVIGYNRLDSIKRLLKSLLCVDYRGDAVDLIISIDYSGAHNVLDYANQFEWPYGIKKVYTYPKRMGLRNHILHCGDFVQDYEAIAVFEDDLYAAPGFYHYMKEAVSFYKDDDRIAGISLYSYLCNVNIKRNFQAAASRFDTYFLQLAQSWGQVWTKNQWNDFRDWYDKNKNRKPDKEKYPEFIVSWPKTSWLKYHIMYCVENKKYFVYPYVALATCFSDQGEHTAVKSNLYQVPFASEVKEVYYFATLDTDAICYDVFFERQGLGRFVGIKDSELCVNLYGTKRYIKEKYQLTMQSFSRKVLKSYALELRPQEMNIIAQIPGGDIFLYDMDIEQKQENGNNLDIKQFLYYQRITNEWLLLVKVILLKLREKILFRNDRK